MWNGRLELIASVLVWIAATNLLALAQSRGAKSDQLVSAFDATFLGQRVHDISIREPHWLEIYIACAVLTPFYSLYVLWFSFRLFGDTMRTFSMKNVNARAFGNVWNAAFLGGCMIYASCVLACGEIDMEAEPVESGLRAVSAFCLESAPLVWQSFL